MKYRASDLDVMLGILRIVSHSWIVKLPGFCDPENRSAKAC
jgi:hypothetical protein